MNRRILTYGGYFERFMERLSVKEQQKVKYGLLLLKTLEKIPTKFVKHIREGIYELRTEYNGNIFRVFFIFDDGNIVVLFNGFQNKNDKDYTIIKFVPQKYKYFLSTFEEKTGELI